MSQFLFEEIFKFLCSSSKLFTALTPFFFAVKMQALADTRIYLVKHWAVNWLFYCAANAIICRLELGMLVITRNHSRRCDRHASVWESHHSCRHRPADSNALCILYTRICRTNNNSPWKEQPICVVDVLPETTISEKKLSLGTRSCYYPSQAMLFVYICWRN